MQLQLVVGGRQAPSFGPWGGLTYTTCLQGSDTATWQMDRMYRRLRGRQSVRIYDATQPIWSGILSAPAAGDTQYSAQGLWKEAYNYRAIDVGGAPTPIPDDAIDGAIARGLPWTRTMSFNTGTPTAMSADLQGEVPSLGDLLDTWCDRFNRYWMVNGSGEVVFYFRPTTPDVIIVPDQPLNPADDEYATTLYGIRKTSGGVKIMVPPVTDADAAARWGAKEDVVDLTDYGNMTEPVATDVLTGVLAKRRARLGFSSGLTLTPDRITTSGGHQAYLPVVRAGMLARELVQWDDTRDLNGRTYRDFLIAGTTYSTTDPAFQIIPEGLAPRDFTSVLRRFKRQHRRDRGRHQ